MKKVLYGILSTLLLWSCSDSKELSQETLMTVRGNYVVDLFPAEETPLEETKHLTYEEALSKSQLVLVAPNVQKVDSAYGRGVQKSYIYRISEGYVAKSPEKIKIPSEILFISKEDLFKERILTDSISVFLLPLNKYKILRNYRKIDYEWLPDAPLLRK